MAVTMVVAAAAGYMLVPSRRTLALGAMAMALSIHPLLAVMLGGLGVVGRQLVHIRQARDVTTDNARQGVLAFELVGLGVTAGLPFRNAATLTADQLDGPVALEISKALRSVGAGQQPLIEMPELQSMFSAAEASETTGMPLVGTLNSLALDRRRADAAASRERLAKLPVKMLFPLAFLILPGFVLLTVVPPLMSGLSRLGV